MLTPKSDIGEKMMSMLLMAGLLAAQEAEPVAERQRMFPSEAVDMAEDQDWVEIAADDLLVVTLKGDRRIVFQLASDWAPYHVANMRLFATSGYWEGATVYRVQDNYVAQFGLSDIERDNPQGVIDNPPAEYVKDAEGINMTLLGSSDPYSMAAGFANGWPVALYADGTASLTHCYGTLGVGRDVAPSTGSGAELYAIIGHAPRHLDRNIAIVGRAIEGIEHLASLSRGSGPLGFLEADKGEVATPITSMQMASAMPEAERPRFAYLSEDSDAFSKYLDIRSNRYDSFYDAPAGGVALCNAPVPIKNLDG